MKKQNPYANEEVLERDLEGDGINCNHAQSPQLFNRIAYGDFCLSDIVKICYDNPKAIHSITCYCSKNY